MSAALRKKLERWDTLSTFIKFILFTGHVENGRPQSTFIISDPGHGKTELLERFRVNDSVEFHSDATNMTIIDSLRKVNKGLITHVCFTEFQKILARRKAVSDATVTILMQAMEEGIHKVSFGPRMHDLHGARLGVIAATTITSVHKNPFLVTELALDSRAFFIDGSATEEEIHAIEQMIAAGDLSAVDPLRLKFPDRSLHVDLPQTHAEKIRLWVREMEKKEGVNVYGLRTFTRFLHTIKGVTLSHGRDVVRREDVEELYSYRDLWLAQVPLPDNSSQAKMKPKAKGKK